MIVCCTVGIEYRPVGSEFASRTIRPWFISQTNNKKDVQLYLNFVSNVHFAVLAYY